MSSYAGKDFFFNYLIYFWENVFDNSLLNDHTGSILGTVVVFVPSA